MERREENARVAALALDVGKAIARRWGGGGVGLALTHAYFQDNPWLTARQLAAATSLSEDTASRRLAELENIGRVVSRPQGRGKAYRAAEPDVRWTVYQLRQFQSADCGEQFHKPPS